MMRRFRMIGWAFALVAPALAVAPGVANAGKINAGVRTLDNKATAGATVRLYKSTNLNQPIKTGTTDSKGLAVFSGVAVGKYWVRAVNTVGGSGLISVQVKRDAELVRSMVTLIRDRPGVFRYVNGAGYFFLDTGVVGYDNEQPIQFGLLGDIPVTGDWDGKGKDRVGVFRDGWFYLDTGKIGYNGEAPLQFGFPGDIPIVGDWEGTGKDRVGVFRVTNGLGYFILDHGKPGYQITDPIIQFGQAGDAPIVGNWTGKGKKDMIGVHRRGAIIQRDASGKAKTLSYTTASRQVVTGDWEGTGVDRIGFYGSFNAEPAFHLDTGKLFSSDQAIIQFGWAGDYPLIGNWEGY